MTRSVSRSVCYYLLNQESYTSMLLSEHLLIPWSVKHRGDAVQVWVERGEGVDALGGEGETGVGNILFLSLRSNDISANL